MEDYDGVLARLREKSKTLAQAALENEREVVAQPGQSLLEALPLRPPVPHGHSGTAAPPGSWPGWG